MLDRTQQRYLLVLLVLIVVGAGFEAIGVGLIVPFMNMLQDPASDSAKQLVHLLRQLHLGAETSAVMMWAAGLLLAVFILKNSYLALVYFFQFRILASMQVILGSRLLTAYLFSPYTFHLQRNTAGMLKNVSGEIVAFFMNFLVPCLVIVSEVLVVGALLAVLLVVDFVTTLVAIGAIGGIAVAFFYGVRKKTREYGRTRQLHNEEMIKWVNQGLGSIKETKVLGRESFFVKSFMESMAVFSNAGRYLQTVNNLPRLCIEVLAVTALLLIVLMTLVRGHAIQTLTPTLALFGLAAFRIMPSMNRIVSMATQITYYKSAMDAIYEDLTMVKGTKPTSQWTEKQRQTAPLRFARAITVENVTYRYPGAPGFALQGISLTISKGAAVGLVGPSGAGKTTLIDILLGLLAPSEGRILVDGQNVSADIVPSWQRSVGYIPQTIYLTDDSVRRNIAFGLPDHLIDDAKVWAALYGAQLEKTVAQLPQGLDTGVGERGIRLSGGERQRIGIARALYHDPQFMVLDEATSSLDYDTENQIVQSIDQLRRQKTLIVIAHRLSTVRNCDCIYRICDGRLEGIVTYEELVQNHGVAERAQVIG